MKDKSDFTSAFGYGRQRRANHLDSDFCSASGSPDLNCRRGPTGSFGNSRRRVSQLYNNQEFNSRHSRKHNNFDSGRLRGPELFFNSTFNQLMPKLDPKFQEIVSKDWSKEIHQLDLPNSSTQKCPRNFHPMDNQKNGEPTEIFIDGGISEDSVEMLDHFQSNFDEVREASSEESCQEIDQKDSDLCRSVHKKGPNESIVGSSENLSNSVQDKPSEVCAIGNAAPSIESPIDKKLIKPKKTTTIELVVDETSHSDVTRAQPKSSVNKSSTEPPNNQQEGDETSAPSSSNLESDAVINDDDSLDQRKRIAKATTLEGQKRRKEVKQNQFDVVGNILRLSTKTFHKTRNSYL